MPHFLEKVKDKIHHHEHHTEEHTEAQHPTPIPTQHNVVPTQHNVDMTFASLYLHNQARNAKNVPGLNWDDQLAKDAASYAETLAAKDKLEHSGTPGQGENLFFATNDATFEDAIKAWLAEEPKYMGEKIGEGNLADWGHYTQCVWHGSTHVGMGKARAKSGATYIVARYTPQGNIIGDKPY